MLEIRALGGLAVEREGRRLLGAAAQPRRLALLAMIARAGPRGIARDRLQSTLWPESDDESGRHALKQALYALRRDAGAGELFLGTREIQLNPDEVRCDVVEFEELVRRGELERAAARYEGAFLDGFRLSAVPEFENWMEDERLALERTLIAALTRLAATARQRRDVTQLVQWMRRRAALEPLNARVTLELMQALLDAGDQTAALQQARIYEALVAQALDMPPDATVLALVRDIREGRAAVATPASVATILPTPSAVASTLPPEPNAPAQPPNASQSNGTAVLPASDSAPHIARGTTPAQVAHTPSVRDRSTLTISLTTFAAIPDDAAVRAFRDGLREELLSAFARIAGLRVIGRATPASNESVGSTPTVALSAESSTAILEGSVRVADDRVRVTARLLDPDGGVAWSERFDRPMSNAIALQDELSASIAEACERALRESAGLPRAPSARERADELYAAGMRAWTPQGAGLGQGLEQFRQAVAIDPSHARAHAALAESYTQLAFFGFFPARRAAVLVDAESKEAMRLAPDLAESHLARGTSLLWVEREFEEGITELVRALEINPTLIVAQARLAFVQLCHDGPLDTGRDVALRAATAVGASGLSRVMYGQQLLAAGRIDDAIEALHAAIDIEAPSFLAYHWLCAAYVESGRGSEAVAAAVAEASLSDRHPWSLTSLVIASALAGQRRRAETLLATLESRAATSYVQSSQLGLARAALGDLDGGMAHLERAVDEHDPSMMMVRTFPMFAPFRAHPRFRALLRTAGWRDWDTAEFRVPHM